MTISISKGETVRVVAPATLSAGYTFDAVVDGKTISVTVPSGGVGEGETFDAIIASPAAYDPEIAVVPIPLDESLIASTTTKTVVRNADGTQTVTEETVHSDGRTSKTVSTITDGPSVVGVPMVASATKNAADVPTGKWRHDMFACFDTCGNGMFWMAWCCTYLALGQLLQRLKLNVCGQPGDYKNTCIIWTIIWAVLVTMYSILVSVTNGYGIFIYAVVGIIALVALSNARYHMRTKWSIPADCCDNSGCLSDCCCAYWCTCCSIIQMMRHTHDERADYYNFGSSTGLDVGAAEVV